jgi:O-antigen/teichoic acid export membrane protein
VIDQGISSASNLLFVASVAHSSDVREFGAFSLAYLSYGLLLGTGRAIGGDILLLRTEQQPSELEADSRRLLGLALVLGAVGGLGACSLAGWAGGTASGALFALGAVLPFLLMQDALRYCLFARRRAALAAANDLVWLSVQVVATLALLFAIPDVEPPLIVLAWASGAAAALGAGLWQTRLTPAFHGVLAGLTHDWARVSSFFGDFAMHTGSAYASAYLIAIIGRVEDVAAVRGGMLLFAPLDALFLGIRVVILPLLARSVALGGFSLSRHARLVAVLSAALTAGWALAALSLPEKVGRVVLGPTWEVVTPIIIPIAFASVARYVAMPSQAGLWALGEARWIVGLRVTVTLVVLTSVIVGTFAAGAVGAAIGLAVAYVTQSILSWSGFLSRSRRLLETSRAGEPGGVSR